MENILVFPSSEKEKSLIEELLQKMKVKFKNLKDDKVLLSEEEVKSIEEGLEDFENGNHISSEEVRKMMAECLK